VWRWKDHIDRTWMRGYGHTVQQMMESGSAMKPEAPLVPTASQEDLTVLAAAKMRCAGCGGKVTSLFAPSPFLPPLLLKSDHGNSFAHLHGRYSPYSSFRVRGTQTYRHSAAPVGLFYLKGPQISGSSIRFLSLWKHL
jgi:hypothetical protein